MIWLKYILPFGYTLNKLFTSNWSEKNYDGINFYDVFDRLLSMEEKTDEFKEGKTYEIPKESFETIFQKYFNISASYRITVRRRNRDHGRPGNSPAVLCVARKESISGILMEPTTVRGSCVPPS